MTTARRLLLLGLAVCTVAACTVSVEQGRNSARPDGNDLESAIDELVAEALASGPVAGISVAVDQRGERLLAKGYGLADIENEVVAAQRTVYRIGSITKQFTAAAIMRLVEEGQVALGASLAEYAPEFPTQGREVTIAQLLNHTSGIRSYTGLGEAFWSRSRLELSHEDLLGLVSNEPFDFEPGERWLYNNSGYYLLGVVIENVTGQTYAEHLQERFFGPLGLESTTYCDERRLIPHRAEGYAADEGKLFNDEPLSMSSPFAAGALCSTVEDLLVWQHALEAGEVVSPAAYAQMTTPLSLTDGSELSYGFGLGVGELEGHRKISHGGGINGFVTALARYPEDELSVVVLTNTEGPTAGQLEQQIARLVLGLEPLPEEPEDE